MPGQGDLVEKPGLAHPENWAPVRSEPLAVGSFQNDLKPVSDAASPLVLIGDSFANIFDDPGLGFGLHVDGSRSRAGLAWQLSSLTGANFDMPAVNGEGASGVRRWLAQRGESVVRSKKLVIWVIAERDLFLSRSVAKANHVSWDRVAIAPDPPAIEPGKVYRLDLAPWAVRSELQPINREELGDAAPGWWGATAEPVP